MKILRVVSLILMAVSIFFVVRTIQITRQTQAMIEQSRYHPPEPSTVTIADAPPIYEDIPVNSLVVTGGGRALLGIADRCCYPYSDGRLPYMVRQTIDDTDGNSTTQRCWMTGAEAKAFFPSKDRDAKIKELGLDCTYETQRRQTGSLYISGPMEPTPTAGPQK